MSNSTISGLPDGGALQAGDELVVARGSGDYRILASKLADLNALAKALGLKAWTFHPADAALAATQVNTHLQSVYLEEGDVITYLSVPVTVAGATMTHAWLGIYDSGLNLVAVTADSPAAFQTTGWVELALTTPYTVPASGLYYLASGFLGTTLPTVLNQQQNQAVVGTALPGGSRLGVHAQVPTAAGLPNPAVSQGTYSNCPLILAR